MIKQAWCSALQVDVQQHATLKQRDSAFYRYARRTPEPRHTAALWGVPACPPAFLKAKITASQLRRKQEGKRVHPTTLRYVWAREFGERSVKRDITAASVAAGASGRRRSTLSINTRG
jgi:hypothetical protein